MKTITVFALAGVAVLASCQQQQVNEPEQQPTQISVQETVVVQPTKK